MSSVGGLHAELDGLLAADASELSDAELRAELRGLLAASNRLHAAIADRVVRFDERALSVLDGFKTTAGWLRGFGRLSGSAASRLVSAARLLCRLPGLAAAAGAGRASPEHVTRVSVLAAQVGVEAVMLVDDALAQAAA